MPNHVDQDLIVTGEVSILKKFLEFAQDDKHFISADKFLPYPRSFKIEDEVADDLLKQGISIINGYNSGGYEWCLQNWGTKWGIYNDSIKISKLTGKNGKLKFNFNSAWSPVNKIVIAMSQQFPLLHFELKYYERGMKFKGIFIVEAGNILKDIQEKYNGKRGG